MNHPGPWPEALSINKTNDEAQSIRIPLLQKLTKPARIPKSIKTMTVYYDEIRKAVKQGVWNEKQGH
ncbi:MAG: hypothetical protein UX91_C0015G0013 [Candidatus Amesbacteria bacterium GW2011_GWB1_47_19]|nr:MAG: hypothetical protein UX91_C0015G0013 [Candidatus Amesbacteria bacterium GW2011_GWB1_47_19]